MLNKNTLRIIDAKDIPPPTRNKEGKYTNLFQKIPEGKAAILDEEEINVFSLRITLDRLQKTGKFKKITIQKTGKKIYIINNASTDSKTEKQQEPNKEGGQ